MKIYIRVLPFIIAPLLLIADSNATQRITVKQLFNVKKSKIIKIKSSKSKKYYGYTKVDESSIYDISPRYSGYTEKLYADNLYSIVKKGDTLATVYSPEVLQAKEDYLNSINFNNSRSSAAMKQSAKLKLELLGIPSKEIYDIRKSGKSSQYTDIISPISGWVFEKRVNNGSSFKRGERAFQIVNLDTIWVEAKIYQEDIGLISKWNSFEIRSKGVDRSYKAKKLLFYPALDPKDATATLRLEVANSDGKLTIGSYTTITISDSSKERLVIPRKATIRKDGKWYAFLATEFKGEYDPIEIEVKPLDREYYEVTKGLSEGEEVVDNALFMMDSDTQINGLY